MRAVVVLTLLAACGPPADTAIVAAALDAEDSNEVHCNCVINDHAKNGVCANPAICPGDKCPCAGVDFNLCLPPDLNHDTATDAAVKARLADKNFDFSTAVNTYCEKRASVIMTDMGAVSEHALICDGKAETFLIETFQLDEPALVSCRSVAYLPNNAPPVMTSTWHSAECAVPCSDVPCVNGPQSQRPNENCQSENVFSPDGSINLSGCACNQVAASDSCNGEASEVFCSPRAGD